MKILIGTILAITTIMISHQSFAQDRKDNYSFFKLYVTNCKLPLKPNCLKVE